MCVLPVNRLKLKKNASHVFSMLENTYLTVPKVYIIELVIVTNNDIRDKTLLNILISLIT